MCGSHLGVGVMPGPLSSCIVRPLSVNMSRSIYLSGPLNVVIVRCEIVACLQSKLYCHCSLFDEILTLVTSLLLLHSSARIDLVFGYKQRGPNAVKAHNVF